MRDVRKGLIEKATRKAYELKKEEIDKKIVVVVFHNGYQSAKVYKHGALSCKNLEGYAVYAQAMLYTYYWRLGVHPPISYEYIDKLIDYTAVLATMPNYINGVYILDSEAEHKLFPSLIGHGFLGREEIICEYMSKLNSIQQQTQADPAIFFRVINY